MKVTTVMVFVVAVVAALVLPQVCVFQLPSPHHHTPGEPQLPLETPPLFSP